MPAKSARQTRQSAIPETCSKRELAELLGISERTVDTWTQRGVMQRADRGRYRILESSKAYCEAMRTAVSAAPTGNGALASERLQSLRLTRQIKERELALIDGQTLTQDDVAAAWSSLVAAIRSAVAQIPDHATDRLPALTPHDHELLRRLCRDLLDDLADTAAGVLGANPEEFRHACP